MLNRQKLVLHMLRLADRPVTKLELVKWAFVLSRETSSRGGGAFYEFLPHHFGPYSFSLQREIDSLVDEGIVEATDKTWACTIPASGEGLSQGVKEDARRIVARFRDRSPEGVLDYVYHSYPAYTVNSKRQKLAERKVADPAIYTAGYEGLQIDGFLDLLVQAGIRRLLDVRNNPVARRYGFHKSTLSRLCGYLDIEYIHFPELGIVSEARQNLNESSDYSKLFEFYERTILPTQTDAVGRVAASMLEEPGVLVCMEAEACRCHRSRLGAEVARVTGLALVHLGAAK